MNQPPSCSRRLFLFLLAAIFVLVAGNAANAANAPYTVIAIVDGPRGSEFLEEPGRPHCPTLDGVLIPGGSFLPNFLAAGETKTLPGHAAILTGCEQPLANDGTERPSQPTLFEKLRKEKGLPITQTWLVGGKDKFLALGYSTHPDYGAAYQASTNATLRDDVSTYGVATQVLAQSPPPTLTVIAFSSVDLLGHAGDWPGYLSAITVVDSLLGELWSFIESDPVLGGNTNLFITSDHGRHLDSVGGFQEHGDTCDGCRRLPFVALGPDIKSGASSTKIRRQEDVETTVAYLMGLIQGPITSGFVMSEILVNPPVVSTEDTYGPRLPVAQPNPFRFTTRLVASQPMTSMEVFDIRGGQIYAVEKAPSRSWVWSGTSFSGAAVGAGLYWVRLNGPESNQIVRVTLLP
ncbi:MAG: hypothetical protein HKN21_05815 [Candidatus Eisenbacteria bacterium]|uniref:Metalloenzyme domain-containing protein n=1 Tax=Eiseniibacteriota bacterium TaxID=2212470 RepID=A0A7Y2E6T1_UNCEI|nr:hypothetical protein [Candidatus Eisenbacteria bacterium]